MGYRVVYGDDPFLEMPRSRNRLGLMTAGCFLVFLIGVRWLWPQGTAVLEDIFLPDRGTAAAFRQMTEEIGTGESLGDAVTAFCRTIVEDAVGEAD